MTETQRCAELIQHNASESIDIASMLQEARALVGMTAEPVALPTSLLRTASEGPITEENLLKAEADYHAWKTAFHKTLEMDRWDYVIGSLSGIIAGIIDLALVYNPFSPDPLVGKAGLTHLLSLAGFSTKVKEHSRYPLPFDNGGGFGHRIESLGHDPLCFLQGVRDALHGTMNGKTVNEAAWPGGYPKWRSALPQGHDPITYVLRIVAAVRYLLGHLAEDVNTTQGLPMPGMGLAHVLLSKSSEYSGYIKSLYTKGLDLRQFLVGGLTVATNEVVVRLLRFFRFVLEGRPLVECVRRAAASSPQLTGTLLLAHGTTSAINGGKVAAISLLTENPTPLLALNYAQWFAFARYGMRHAWWLSVARPYLIRSAYYEDLLGRLRVID